MTCACDCPCHGERASIIHKGFVQPSKPEPPKVHTYAPGDIVILLKSQWNGVYPQEGKHFGVVASTYGDDDVTVERGGKRGAQEGCYVHWIGWNSTSFQHLNEMRPATPKEIEEMRSHRGAWGGAKR